jgi:hypothetical protein
MEPDDAPAPPSAPGDYLDDTELEQLLPKLGEEARLVTGDFVDELHLDTIIGLISQTSRREADKVRSGSWSQRSMGRSTSTSTSTTIEEAADAPPPRHRTPMSIPNKFWY